MTIPPGFKATRETTTALTPKVKGGYLSDNAIQAVIDYAHTHPDEAVALHHDFGIAHISGGVHFADDKKMLCAEVSSVRQRLADTKAATMREMEFRP